MAPSNKSFEQIYQLLTKPQMKDLFDNINTTQQLIINDKCYKIIDGEKVKVVVGDDYKYIFDKTNGNFNRWGVTYDDDPTVAPLPELVDIEIVSGQCMGKCSFCYKCNNITNDRTYMTLETFKKIFEKLPKSICQIAFGITDIYANPDFFKIMEYTRQNGVVPNYTTHGLDLDENAVNLTAKLCGAVAVSIVQKERSYDAIKAFTDAKMSQVNCHYMLSQESYVSLFDFLKDIKNDPRLAKLNAVVLLQYKDKNPHSKYHSVLETDKYQKIVEYCTKHKINYGFDSCSAGIYIKSIENDPNREQLEQCVDSCESSRMSFYCNTDGIVYPCSFCENKDEWTTGIDMLKVNDFIKDVWHNEKLNMWRNKLLGTMKNGCAHCPIYNLDIN